MKYLLVNEDDEIYLFTEKEYYEHIAELQNSGFDFEGGIIKQADTIEELCDEFVVVFRKDTKEAYDVPYPHLAQVYTNFGVKKIYLDDFIPLLYSYEFNKAIGSFPQRLNDFVKKPVVIYGAIWTDKGLIYVAKMSEKGELELL